MAPDHDVCAISQALQDLLSIPKDRRVDPEGAERFVKIEQQVKSHDQSIKAMPDALTKLTETVGDIDKSAADRLLKSERAIVSKIEQNQKSGQLGWPFLVSVGAIMLSAIMLLIIIGGLVLSPMLGSIKDLKVAQLKEIDLDVKSIKERAQLAIRVDANTVKLSEYSEMMIAIGKNNANGINGIKTTMTDGLIRQRDALMKQVLDHKARVNP